MRVSTSRARSFLAIVVLAIAIAACGRAAPPRVSPAGSSPQARAEAIARTSPGATRAYAAIVERAQAIRGDALRRAVTDLLAHPKPTFVRALPDAAARARVRDALVAAALLDAKTSADDLFPPPSSEEPTFLAAPGGPDDGHHAYPGGLAEHTAFNLQTSLDLAERYARAYGLESLDRDTLIAAPILHDVLKAWVLRWRADGTLTAQATVAGTSSHHPFVVAEAIYRGLPADFVVTLAAAHDAPMIDAAKVAGYLRAGAILAGVDPIAAGLLVAKDGALTLARPAPVEASIHHLSDHDWVLVEPAAHLVVLALERVVRAAAPAIDEATLRWARHRIEARVATLRLYALWRDGGDAAIARALRDAAVPLVDPNDAPPR